MSLESLAMFFILVSSTSVQGRLLIFDHFHGKEKGATITFTTPNYGLAFYTGQRTEGAA